MPETRDLRDARDVHESFAFEDAGRSFSCCVETAHHRSTEVWWWFRVSSERHARFAPFRAVSGDRLDVVQGRILAYYDDLLARRAAPVTMGWGRGRPSLRPTAVPASTPTFLAAGS